MSDPYSQLRRRRTTTDAAGRVQPARSRRYPRCSHEIAQSPKPESGGVVLYLGGKGRLGKIIAGVILGRTARRAHYVEPFLGGGNAFRHLAPHFGSVCAGDVHLDLILMWQAAANGWTPPRSVGEAEYAAARLAPSSALRGFIGFGCSYGGKWWGGYARNKVVGMKERSHPDYYARLASSDVRGIGSLLRNATVERCSYEAWSSSITSASVVYADPPYAGTTKYKGDFDHGAFWAQMDRWCDLGADVFVSEYNAPPGWSAIWSRDQPRKVSGGSGAMTTEKIFVRSK